jgi:GTPase
MFKKPPVIAIVGRTNVGKSTLFNRLLEKPKAIVSDVPGTTRDRNEGDCLWRGRIVRLVDTGGMDIDKKVEIELDILEQAKYAMKHADIILFLVDLRSGAMPQERDLAKMIRESGKPVIMVGNKAEKLTDRLSVSNPEWNFPGLPEPMAISGIRGTGTGDLLDKIYEMLNEMGKPPTSIVNENVIRVAVIGKPNVGKSTLLNSLIGEDRFITSAVAHTTREPNDILISHNGKTYVFVDTAGMRKKGKVKKAGGLEAISVRRNERVVKLADVTILVVDSNEPIGTQEKTLAGYLKDSGSGVLVVANKWDLVPEKTTGTMDQYRKYFAGSLPFLRWAPVTFVSALTKQRVKTLFDKIDLVAEKRATKLTTQQLSQFLAGAMSYKKPIKGKGTKPPKLLALNQTDTKPPLFELVIKSKRTDFLGVSYVRFLENRLRAEFDLVGTPLRIGVRIVSSGAK